MIPRPRDIDAPPRSQLSRSRARARLEQNGPPTSRTPVARPSSSHGRPAAARPRVSQGILLTALGKILGMATLLVAAWLIYDVASSPELTVGRVTVSGNRMLTTGEIEATASASGVNMFWIRRSDLSQRLRLLPPVESAEVSLELPDHLFIQVTEREPAAIWISGEVPFLVDAEGLVLGARPPERALPVVRDTSGQAIMPGERVKGDVVRSLSGLDHLLVRTFGPQQRQYEYTRETGMNVVQSVGPRLILGDGEDLDWKLSAIQAVVRHIESERKAATLIDVRFSDRPYYR